MFVVKKRAFLWIIGLMTVLACTNAPERTSTSDTPISKPNDSIVFPVNQKPTNVPSFDKTLQQFVQDDALRHAAISIQVTDNQTGATWAAHQPHLSVSPASCIKLITTASGLAILGAAYRFETVLAYSGTLQGGVLNGDVYIIGGGDPTLGSDQWDAVPSATQRINDMVGVLQQKGIRRIQGRVVGDAAWLSTAVCAESWAWNDLGNYYACGAWGLNWHENLYYLFFKQNPILGGKPAISHTFPAQNITWHNELTSGARTSGDNAYIFGAPYTHTRFVRGSIPLGNGTFRIKGAMPNPPLAVAQDLYGALQKAGIAVSEAPITNLSYQSAPQDATTLHTFRSPPLSEISQICNEESINLYAEAILRAIAKQQTGNGDIGSGLQAIQDYWAAKGWQIEGLFLKDGSGLSPQNALSAAHLSQFLYLVYQDKTLYPIFKNTLAVGGASGTLKGFFRGTAAQNRIFGKSGSMESVRCYAGYADTASGKQLSFSMFVNHYTCTSRQIRQKMEALMVAICGE